MPFHNYIEIIEDLKTQKKYTNAKTYIEEMLIKNHTDYRLYEELADVCIFIGEIKEAEKAVRYALELNPESATGLYLLGYIHISKGNFKLGIELLEKSNILIPNNPEVMRNLGWGLTMLGDTKRGIHILKRALNLNPNDELIMEDLGVALVSTGKIREGGYYLKKIGKESRIREIGNMMG